MGTPTEKQETTEYAIKKIDENLAPERYNVAILLAFIYLGIRLRSLLTDQISPDKPKWKETHRVLGSLGFRSLLKHCKEFDLITEDERDKLSKLADKRHYIAHESVLWRSLTDADVTNIKGHCEFAKKFLRDHS
jgi:hypothetical protein